MTTFLPARDKPLGNEFAIKSGKRAKDRKAWHGD